MSDCQEFSLVYLGSFSFTNSLYMCVYFPHIFTVLSERFSQAEVEPVRAALETVSDLTLLTELFRIGLHISSAEAFLHTIDPTDG